MKTSELQGYALDWAVAKCEKVDDYILYESFMTRWTDDEGDTYRYSTDWSQGAPIVEREKINLGQVVCERQEFWTATMYLAESEGPTPLVAAMRCYVASKLGDEVDVPDELLEGEQA
jgi:hypothetical protein